MGSGHRKGWKKEQFKRLTKAVVARLKREPLSKQDRKEAAEEARNAQRRNEAFNLIGYGLGLVSWAWTVLAPQSSATFGSILLGVAALIALVGVRRAFGLNRLASCLVFLGVFGGLGVFDWLVVISPQRGKPFKALLIDGYHLTSQCGSIPAREVVPDWMKQQSTEWLAKVGQLVDQDLDAKESQMWRDAAIVGLVRDKDIAAYQCTNLAYKVSALETIIASEFDPKLAHQEYVGPLYWFDAQNGKVDITEVLQKSGGKANVYLYGGEGQTQIVGKMPGTSK